MLLAFAVACGGSSSDGSSKEKTPVSAPGNPTVAAAPSPVAGCGTARTHAAGDFDETITSGGTPRTYILHIPTGYQGTASVPLVVVLHGFAQTARQMLDYTKFGQLADQRGFIVAAPNGAGSPPRWNSAKAINQSDDVAFVRELIAKLSADLCVDTDRVFAAGYSAGGGMSRALACDLADRIAAIGTVAATTVACVAAVPMVSFHGTADPQVPFEGGPIPAQAGGGTFTPARRSASEWSRALGCDGLGVITRPAATVELSTFTRCKIADGDVLLYTLLGGGHTWPGSTPYPESLFGSTNTDIDATSTMWDFFSTHPLAH
jgi:polyhydroxybutyrate depolymerase